MSNEPLTEEELLNIEERPFAGRYDALKDRTRLIAEVRRLLGIIDGYASGFDTQHEEIIRLQASRDAAVLAEREACAREAERRGNGDPYCPFQLLAAAIRARQ